MFIFNFLKVALTYLAAVIIPIIIISFISGYRPSLDDIDFSKKSAFKNFKECYLNSSINDDDILRDCINAKDNLFDITSKYRNEIIEKKIPLAEKVIIKFNQLIDEIPKFNNLNREEYFIIASDDIDWSEFLWDKYTLDLNTKIAFRANLSMFNLSEDENIISFDFIKNISDEFEDSYDISVYVNTKNLKHDYSKLIEICEFISVCKFNIYGQLKEKEIMNTIIDADYISIHKIPSSQDMIKHIAERDAYIKFRSNRNMDESVINDKFESIYNE